MINPNSLYANDRFCRWTSWFITPAVKEDSCKEDHKLINLRVTKVGFSALVAYISAGILLSIYRTNLTNRLFIVFGITSILSVFLTLFLNERLAFRVANMKAVNEYLTMPYPSHSATWRIQSKLEAAQLLINKKGDINKIDEQGDRLLSYLWDFDVFKLLIDHGMDVKAHDKYGYSFFQNLLKSSDLSFVKYVLTNKKVKPEDFDPTEQIQFWIKLDSSQKGYLLKQHGFDVNIRDKEGYTPLLRLAKVYMGTKVYMGNLDICLHVTLLLNCGADPLMTVKVGDVEKNALELFHAKPEVQKILQAHQKKNKI